MDQSDGIVSRSECQLLDAFSKNSVFSKNLDVTKGSSIAWTPECLEATEPTEFKQEGHSHMFIWRTFKHTLKKPRDHGNNFEIVEREEGVMLMLTSHLTLQNPHNIET